jgi:hypothetical protein
MVKKGIVRGFEALSERIIMDIKKGFFGKAVYSGFRRFKY